MHIPSRYLPAFTIMALVGLVATPGCSRNQFRQRTDNDVAGVITQKNVFPDWQVKNWHVYPDPRARFADPSNPDRPPYPPDDPAARLLSPNPQRPTKKSGVGRYEGDGYMHLLRQWDTENRARNSHSSAYRSPVQRPDMPASTKLSDDIRPPWAPGGPEASVVRSKNADSVTPDSDSVTPDSDSVAFPKVVAKSDSTNLTPVSATRLASPHEFTPWVAAGRLKPGPVLVVERLGTPGIPPVHTPALLIYRNSDPESRYHTIPAGRSIPAGTSTPALGTPTLVPDEPPPVPWPEPIPLPKEQPNPGKQPSDPLGKGPATAPSGFDPAADYLRALQSNQVGYRITMPQAVELGLLNAREFQDRREDLYLAALPVTLERFNFATLGFLTYEAVRRSSGRDRTGAGELWSLNTEGGVSKLFPTGALLVVRLANQLVIDLTSNDPRVSVSNLSLSLAQPFLRGGGRAVTLEGLTLAERNLLYAMRSYARFRKIFYVAIAAGGNYTNNPYGLQGLSPNLGRGIGGNLTAPNVGYLPLLLQSAIINNQRRNVLALERLLAQYRAFREGGQQSDLQVGQVEVQLLNSRGQLLGSATAGGGSGIRGYLDALDNFKLQLGLPMTVPLELDDTPLQPIREQLSRFEEVYAQMRALELAAAQYDPATPVAQFRTRWRTLLTTDPLVRGTEFAKNIGARWDAWGPVKMTEAQLDAAIVRMRERRRELLAERLQYQLKKEPEPQKNIDELLKLNADLDLALFERAVRDYEAQPWAKKEGPARIASQQTAFTAAFNAFYVVVLEGRNERLAQVRTQWPALPPIPIGDLDALDAPLDDAYTAGIQAALSNRLDLMNARGQVVDAWRQIAVQANSLQGVFDVRYDLNSNTPTDRRDPFGFSASRTSHQLTIRTELPLVRRAERNNYRAALIAYQRQRRTLMAFEDNISNDVRGDLRELRTLAQLYRIQQRAVELQYSQVDNAQAILLAPPVPGAGSDAGSAAALTQQVLQAQAGLVAAQNELFRIWVAYMTVRMQLYLNLEQLTLDDHGVWCDEFSHRSDYPSRHPDAWPGQQPAERLPAPRPVLGGSER